MNSPYKMKGKSPMMKALIGKQGNLPTELKNKILASPAKNKVVDTLKKVYEGTMPKVVQKVNKKIYDKVTGGKSKAKKKSKVVDFSKKDSNYDVKFTKSEPKAKQTKTKTKKQTEIERYENDHINKKTGESLFKYKKSPAKKPTDRKEKIAKNIEFNKVARKTGILPNFKTTKEKEKFYSNKANVNMLNTKQKEYFKNKK